ncbi:MAG: CxxC-x17-CxxC domain-containing protein [Thermomicrobiales bacterium]|jgi:CxxC-x17-CxxC domain-containing protein
MSDLTTFAVPLDRACIACGKDFVVTPAEVAFRSENRLPMPDLCPACRARQRSDRNADIVAAYAKAGNAAYADVVTPAAPARKGSVRGQMYATVCDSCGAETKVPFIPRGDRPVYCRDCYNARRGR